MVRLIAIVAQQQILLVVPLPANLRIIPPSFAHLAVVVRFGEVPAGNNSLHVLLFLLRRLHQQGVIPHQREVIRVLRRVLR